MTDIAALTVRLSAETSQYTAAIQKATEQMSSFSDTVSSSIADVAKNFLGLEALKEVFDFTDNIVKSMASFENLSHAVGSTTESLSQLSFAAKLSGVDDIGAALEKMARSAGLAETGNAKLQGTFASLGVSLTDSSGKLKSSDQLFLDIADAVSHYNDGLAKTSVVQAIFGKSSAEYIAFLDQGAAAIEAAKLEAIALGVDVSSSSAKAADEFEKDMVRIGAAGKGVFYKAIEEVLPQFDGLTKQIIAFAEGTGNTDLIVEQLAAGFKVIGTVLVTVGTGFEVVGAVIGGVSAAIGQQIDALYALATAVLHPIDSFKSLIAAEGNTFGILGTSVADAVKTLNAGGSAVEEIWGHAFDHINEGWDDWNKKPKPELNLIDQTQVKALESAIEALAKLDDKLKEQVATYGLNGAAATAYDLTLGKLSASVAEVDKMSLGQAQQALAALEKQGKLTKASIDEINAAVKSGIPIGEAMKTAILNNADALDKLKGVDALSKLDSQLLTMTGHLQAASQAAFDLANRPLQINIQTAQDKTAFSGLDNSQAQIAVTSQINALKAQALAIEDALGKKTADVDASGLAAGESSLQIAGEEAVARQNALSQLEALYVKAQSLANATGMKSAVQEANALRAAMESIQFNPKIVADVNAATEAQKKLLEVMVQEKKANDDLSLTMADLAKQSAQGSITDLDYMSKQDDARQKEIDQLTIIQAQLLDIVKNNPGNAQALDDYKKLGVQIDGIEAQMNQLAKTVRTDLTDDLSNAFVGFADGSETAKKALQSFVSSFTKQMLDLASKQMFQKLFESTGANDEILNLFGMASKTASGIASTGAAATGTDNGALANTIKPFVSPAGIDSLFGTASSDVSRIASPFVSPAGINSLFGVASADVSSIASTGAAAVGADAGALANTINPFAAAAPVIAGVEQNQGTGGGIGNIVGSLDESGASGLGGTTAAATSMGTALTTAASTGATAMGTAITEAGSVAADAMGAAIAGASAGGAAVGAGGGIAGGAAFAAFAAGGSFTGGAPILVGENGPELIVPDVSGAVIPNNVIAQYIPELSTVLNVPQPPNPLYPTTTVNGVDVPVGLTETFTTDKQGFTTINEDATGYVGMVLPAGTLTGSGSNTLTATDLSYLTLNQLAENYEPGYLAQQYANTTLASYAAEFGPGTSGTRATSGTAAQLGLGPAPASNGGVAGAQASLSGGAIPSGGGGGISTISTAEANYAAELQNYANQELSGYEATSPAALPAAAYAGVGLVPSSSLLVGTEAAIAQPNLLDARQYESLLTNGYLQKRASGGPVSAGTPYLVGENGPELMVPDSNGTVMNSWDDSQSNRSTIVNQTNHFHIQSATGKVDNASQQQIATRTLLSAQAASARNS